jgi:hypothetical protein
MNPRYQIEEIVHQDVRGIVFRGIDDETEAPVSVRRFFPFGPDGGGLEPDERQSYDAAVASLRGVRHPSLRAVLDGGCDPVDGLPYLVTEWVEGPALGEWLHDNGPLPPRSVAAALKMVFDVCGRLSGTLGRDAVWIDLTMDAVTVVTLEDGFFLSFGISPWRWLGVDGEEDAFAGVAMFAESLLGWNRKVVADGAGAGFGGWIRRLRSGEIAAMADAESALDAMIAAMDAGIEESESAAAVVQPRGPLRAPPQLASAKSGGHRGMWVAVVSLLIAVGGVGGWLWKHSTDLAANAEDDPAARQARHVQIASASASASAAARSGVDEPPQPANDEAAATTAPAAVPDSNVSADQRRVDEMMARIRGDQGQIAERRARVERDGYFTIHDADLLIEQAGSEVALRGRLARVRFSSTRITMYLEFSESAPLREPRGYALARELVDGIREDDLAPLVGRIIEIRGPVDLESVSSTTRPRVRLADRAAITILADDAGH